MRARLQNKVQGQIAADYAKKIRKMRHFGKSVQAEVSKAKALERKKMKNKIEKFSSVSRKKFSSFR